MAFPKARAIPVLAEPLAFRKGFKRAIEKHRGEFEGEGCNRLGQALERLGLEPFHIDFDKARRPVLRNQPIECENGHLDFAKPRLAFPAGRAVRGVDKAVGGGRDRRICRVELKRGPAPPCARGGADNGGL